jgi:hypothetical protein
VEWHHIPLPTYSRSLGAVVKNPQDRYSKIIVATASGGGTD